MTPNFKTELYLTQNDQTNKEVPYKYKLEIVWRNVAVFIYLHIAALMGVYYAFTTAQWNTWLWTLLLILFSQLATGAGVHRLWTHRAYKAKVPLRIILATFQTMCLQNHIYEWARDHRVHHKYTDTNADPHNATRGFFFSHMGWLMCKKHRDVIEKGRSLDLSDLKEDPVVMFQKKYYMILAPLLAFILPALVPWYFWNENLHVGWCLPGMFRYVLSLHGTWLVNSAAHMWGDKPYDKNIKPTENIMVSYITNGEGWHNYHHTFPWDYRAAELGHYSGNWSTLLIDLMAKIGWAYDLKTASKTTILNRIKRTGILDDNNKKLNSINSEPISWGWGDNDMKEEEKKSVDVRRSQRG